MDRPRILYLTSHFPGAQAYGAQLRSYHLARLLAKIGDLEMALVDMGSATAKTLETSQKKLPVRGLYRLESWKKNWLDQISYEFDPFWVNTHGHRIEEASRENLIASLPDYDIVWFHGMRMANILGLQNYSRAVLDIDDIPSQYYSTALSDKKSWRKKLCLRRKKNMWRRREKVLLKRFSSVVVCSERDRRILDHEDEKYSSHSKRLRH